MIFCILIELSKKNISFLYNRSDGGSRFKPFVGDGQALPLAIYCQGNEILLGESARDFADQGSPYAWADVFAAMRSGVTYNYLGQDFPINTLLTNAIQKYLSFFFQDTLMGEKGRLEENIATMPLCFLFNPDVKEEERLFVRNRFNDQGYGNVGVYDYDQTVIKASGVTSSHAACVTSDGQNLFVSYFETRTGQLLDTHTIPNQGNDPRVTVAVNKLWESMGYNNYYLDLDKERPRLALVAQKFLSSGAYEFNDKVLFSDGVLRECFITLHELKYYQIRDNEDVISGVKHKLTDLGISPADTTIVLKGVAANNSYFTSIFNCGVFHSVINVDDKFRTQVFSNLLDEIKAMGYVFPKSIEPKVNVSMLREQPLMSSPSQIDHTTQVPTVDAPTKTTRIDRSKVYRKDVNHLFRSYELRSDYADLLKETNNLLERMHADDVHDFDEQVQKVVNYAKSHMVQTGDPMKYQSELNRLKRGYQNRADYESLLNEASDLLKRMHNDNVHEHDATVQKVIDYAEAHVISKGDSKKYVREVNRLKRGYQNRADYESLLNEASDLLKRMHNDNVHDYDADVQKVVDYARKKANITNGTTVNARTVSRASNPVGPSAAASKKVPSGSEAKYRREVNVLTRGYKMRNDRDKLRQEVEALLKKMHDDGVTSFDDKLREVLSFSNSVGTNSGNDATPKRGSKGSKSKPSPAQETSSPSVSKSKYAIRTKKQDTDALSKISASNGTAPSNKKSVSGFSEETPPPLPARFPLPPLLNPTFDPVQANLRSIKKGENLLGKSLTINKMKFKIVSDGNVEVMIKKCKNEVIIPATIVVDGIELYVTTVSGGGLFATCAGVTSVSLPETITSLKGFAFSFAGFTSIVLPTNLISIGNNAFLGCDNLSELVLPNSVEVVDDHAFKDCKKLKMIQFHGNEFWNDAISGCKALEVIKFTCPPPIFNGKVNSWNNIFDKVQLYVPKAFLNDYKNDPIWSRFKTIKSYNY